MFESTSDYPSNSFQEILLALLNVSAFTERKATPEELTEELKSPIAPQNSQQAGRMHHNNRRVSLIVGKSRMQDEELKFVLDKGNEIARANLERLSSLDKENLEAWQLFSESLTAASANQSIDTSLRLQACNNLNSLIFLTMKPARLGDDETWNRIQTRNLQTLKEHIARLYVSDEVHAKSVPVTVIEIHEQSLDTLHAILEQYAETLTDGWSLVFDLISGVFGVTSEAESVTQGSSSERRHPAHPGGPRLVRAAYKSLHLIASDFVSLLPAPCLLALVQSLNDFASQTQDFNISLTTTTFFWNVSDFLRGRMDKFSVGAYVDASVREDDLEALSCSEDLSVSSHCLWLLLLLRIVDIASDSRSEIRNSAVHTLLRIFDAYGQQLSSKAWRLCLNRVLFSMVGNLSDVLEKVRKKQGPENELKPWIETTVLVIKGVSSLVANFLNVIVSDEDFLQSWKRLFDFLQKLVDMRLLELSEATFASVSSILTQCNSSGELSKEACHCVWTLWANGHPMREENPVDQNRSNQDAALAYMQTLQQLYHLHKSHLDAEHIDTILEHLRLLVWNSIYPPYSPDTERCSAVQALVIGCLRTLCMEKENSQAAILSCLADLSDSPLSKWNPSSDSRKPGFVAFSKTLIDLISWYIAEFGIKQDILSNDALALILERFGALILQKYIWKGKDRDPYMWQKASTATLKVLEVAVPYVEKQYDSAKRADIARFWRCVVNIAHGMVSAHGYQTQQLPHSRIAADEEFDIAAFTRLKCLILPSLGAAIVPDTVRQSFALALFHSSFIYAPQRLDMPLTSIEQDPLRDFYTIRPGRTFDPPPTLRPQMAYVLIDSLFELAATSGSDTPTFSQRTLMACSTAPYLLLRCAISLKSFIADQPLRGLMPQPTPARKELLHLLDSLEHLHSEPSAIPDSTCIKTFSSKEESASGRHYRKHLEWMFPLVVKAVRVAGKERDDGRVLQALSVVLQELGHFE
ncbi:hypothetical protein N7539_001267 [Penicillium diatomitis]|uniref:Mon2 C-terminal domain-containing protein n=1 Tax=Penicillium diatomitis TaxID=2819901 RepID=A0A9X0C350_9EURO|nr:uncharacterized protein N7539_001267 [Penicillium diatomitis]KAJ5496151.1 hypothetical protein N7539_001267 [Penicillium diatomitis]